MKPETNKCIKIKVSEIYRYVSIAILIYCLVSLFHLGFYITIKYAWYVMGYAIIVGILAFLMIYLTACNPFNKKEN